MRYFSDFIYRDHIYTETKEAFMKHEFKRLDSIPKHFETKPRVVQSVVISSYFKDLAIQFEECLTPKIVQFSVSREPTSCISDVLTMMSKVLQIDDKESIVLFLKVNIEKIPISDRNAMIDYLADEHGFKSDLKHATFLDINDLRNALQNGVMIELTKVARNMQTAIKSMDKLCSSVKQLLTDYKWVSTLTYKKKEIDKILKISKGRPLTSTEKRELGSLIGIGQSLVDYDSIEYVLHLLEVYGVLDIPIQSEKVLTIRAASLSLQNILSTTWLMDNMMSRNCYELQFICCDCFYIDASVESQFPGKNLVITASKVVVMNGIQIIDVSGNHARIPMGWANNGKELKEGEVGDGKSGDNGINGRPGQSGGNILICTDEIENSGNLTLRACGGDGGDGQHGGNGSNGRGKPSKEDDLCDFPQNFASVFLPLSGTGEVRQKLEAEYSPLYTQSVGSTYYAYGECKEGSKEGVKILFGYESRNFYRAGFVLSKSTDGLSANGGNAGKGGKGGGGGEKGRIKIQPLSIAEIPNTFHREISKNGNDGKCGDAGNPGKCAHVHKFEMRKKDHLYVDGATVFGTTLQDHDHFITIKDWEDITESDHVLGKDNYGCDKKVAQRLNPNIRTNSIAFIVNAKNPYILTKEGTLARDGEKAEKQTDIIGSTKSVPIDESAIRMQHQLLAITKHFEELENHVQIKLQSQQAHLHLQQQRKKVSRVSKYEASVYVAMDANCVVKAPAVKEPEIPFNRSKLSSLCQWLSEEDLAFFQLSTNTLQEKYFYIVKLIKKLWEEFSKSDDYDHVVKFDEDTSIGTFRMLNDVLLPILQVLHFKHTSDIDQIHSLLRRAKRIVPSHYKSELIFISNAINLLSFGQYRWCVFSEVYTTLPDKFSVTDPNYQSKCVSVHQDIFTKTSLFELKTYLERLKESDAFIPEARRLMSFKVECSTQLPFSAEVKHGLEMLMIFINETNSQCIMSVYVPNILQAIEQEFEAFHFTISNLELLFYLNFIEDKLNKLLDKTKLEEIFCQGILVKKDDLKMYEGVGYLFYNGRPFQIQRVDNFIHSMSITLKKVEAKSSSVHHLRVYHNDMVTLDGNVVNFPDDALLAGQVKIDYLWKQLKQFITIYKHSIPDDVTIRNKIDKLNVPENLETNPKVQLFELFQVSRQASEQIPYDVFSFFPPRKWMQQLMQFTVRKQCKGEHKQFVKEVSDAISDLTECFDKSLYFKFYTQFLQTFCENNGSFRSEVLIALNEMKLLFTNYSLCSLVTQRGIKQALCQLEQQTLPVIAETYGLLSDEEASLNIEELSEAIFDDLMDNELIESTGLYLSNVTIDSIQMYCMENNLNLTYLNSTFFMQQFI